MESSKDVPHLPQERPDCPEESQLTEVMDVSTPVPAPESPEQPEPKKPKIDNADNGNSNGNGNAERRSHGEKRKLEDQSLIFIQEGPCYKIEPKMKVRCRECRHTRRRNDDTVCRFASFRKLTYKEGVDGPVACGFCDPYTDPNQGDIDLWLPRKENPPQGLELDLCKNLITQLGDQFCSLIHQEMEAVEIHKKLGGGPECWKKVVDGVREMCDACATTIFNYHWSCEKCGFMVCIACFKARQNGLIQDKRVLDSEKDEYHWLLCRKRGRHEIENMLLTQIIPGRALDDIGKILHKVRWELDVPQHCGCDEATMLSGKNRSPKKLINNDKISTPNAVETLCEPVLKQKEQPNDSDNDSMSGDSSDEEHFQMLKTLIKKPSQAQERLEETANGNKSEMNGSTLIQPVTSSLEPQPQTASQQNKPQDRIKNDRVVPIKINTLTQTNILYPNVPHMHLCNGTLLRLLDPACKGNYEPFKDVWKRGQPVLVSNVAEKLDQQLWSPAKFSEDFGKQRNDLVNCMTGKIVPDQPMRNFWDGFVDVSKRLKDDNGTPMLLKLKDWPPGDDFAKILPNRFQDLMSALPLKDYTHRTGRLNLAARLPDDFIKPDLGPKMYIAYGDGNHLEKGTTNLHLDISDAVNCMVFVGVPTNCDVEVHNKAVLEAIEDSDCDRFTIKRVTEKKELPGALWHIYRPWDADKIRDLLNKVCVESNRAIEANNDPIHDQVAYLDKNLRKRLRDEYDVLGFPIVQCEGDAVFIPAGAPHQVRNLHNCIKIAEDFVSPENVSHCFQLTEEFRSLSETHTNHEDKLQIKNIVYHAVKDALSVLINAQEANDI